MSAWTNGTYTHKGLALLSKLTQGSSLKITKAVAGTGYVTPENLAKQTSVSGLNYRLSFMSASYPETGTCKLPVVLTNENLTTGYYAKQIGLFANDPDEGEILYFIVQSAKGTEVPAEAETPGYSATWNFYFQYGQADNVNVTVDPSHTVTTDMLNEVRAIAESGVSTPTEGTVVCIDNTAALPLAGLNLYGKTMQNGTPSPESPVELLSVGDSGSVVVKALGANLFDVNNVTVREGNGLTGVINADGSVTVNGTPTGYYAQMCSGTIKLPKGKYFVSGGKNAAGCAYFQLYANKPDGGQKYAINGVFEVDGTEDGDVHYSIQTGNTLNQIVDYKLYPMFNIGETQMDFEPYKSSVALTVNTPSKLRGIPVTSGGNYTDANGQEWVCDEVDFVRGVYVQRVGEIVFDETKNYHINAYQEGYGYHVFGCTKSAGGSDSDLPMLSDKLVYKPWGHFTVDNMGNFVCYEGYSFYISLADQTISTVEAFIEYVRANPITVYFILKTPVETALSAEELASYSNLVAKNPVTTVMNDANAWMKVDCINAQHEKGFRMASSGRTVEGVDYPGCFYRAVDGEIEWLNPPMVCNVEYRTTERRMGKHVYTKLVNLGAMGAKENQIEHGISAFGTVFRQEAYCGGYVLPTYDGDAKVEVSFQYIKWCNTDSIRATEDLYVQLWYTKE